MAGDRREIGARLELALTAARAAGRRTLDFFRRDDLQVDRKEDDSPVTEADREAERILRDRIAAAFPADAICGEEFGETPGRSGYRWILDPIDGTKSFIHGVPLYGTLVGLERAGRGVAGVILIPALDECVYGATGQGAYYVRGGRSPRPARVSGRRTLAEGLFLTSEVASFAQRGAEEAYRRLEQLASLSRTWGDCYGYLLVATGRAEAMVDPIMHVWDAAAIQPVLEEAGGVFTDWSGRPTILGGEGVGANSLVLPEVLAVTRDYRRGESGTGRTGEPA